MIFIISIQTVWSLGNTNKLKMFSESLIGTCENHRLKMFSESLIGTCENRRLEMFSEMSPRLLHLCRLIRVPFSPGFIGIHILPYFFGL